RQPSNRLAPPTLVFLADLASLPKPIRPKTFRSTRGTFVMRFSRRLLCRLLVLSLATWTLPLSASRAAEAKSYDEMVAKAVEFLSTKGQADDGSFSQQ